MGSLIHPELGLDCRFAPKPFVQRPIARFLADVSNVSEKISELDGYVNRLEDERKKIDAFKRELPICMLLLGQEILAAEEELAQCKKLNSEPVLEEFIPLKKFCSDETNGKVEESKQKDVNSRDKMSWMSSVQLWNADSQESYSNRDCSSKVLPLNTDNSKKKKMGEVINRAVMDGLLQNGKNRAFVPFKESSNFPVMVVEKEKVDELPAAGLSLCTPGIKNPREVINPMGSIYSRSGSGSSPATSNLQSCFKAGQLQTSRKQRRCWSPELHRQFIHALQHLGGPQVATPKQIREHMQVDGLTNDEVKSHLQKYRLHMRRVATNSQEKFGESLKQSSPEGPLQLSRCHESDALEDEDEDDE